MVSSFIFSQLICETFLSHILVIHCKEICIFLVSVSPLLRLVLFLSSQAYGYQQSLAISNEEADDSDYLFYLLNSILETDDGKYCKIS